MTISLAEARAIALRSQGLADDVAPFGMGKEGALNAIQHLGYVQVDTISVVQRAHHHVLWSRVPDYQPQMLHELQERDRAVFEYWNHAASYLPMSDFRFSLPLMRQYRSRGHWFQISDELKLAMRRMLVRIRRDGALLLRDVESKTLVGGWSNAAPSKIEKRALHELWMRGQVMIRSRQGFQKVFDLPERCVPDGIDKTPPRTAELAEFHIRRSLRALGIARVSELHYLHDTERASAVKSMLARLVKRGEVIAVRIAEEPGAVVYALPEAMRLASPLRERRVQILSPFDNLVIQRRRVRWLFDFDYIIECYVPAPKRRYGYFVLPVLWGDTFIGRMDAKAHRDSETLVINNFVFEPGFNDMAVQGELAEALQRFATFQGCKRIKVSRMNPKALRKLLP